jgi:hypothetical protein
MVLLLTAALVVPVVVVAVAHRAAQVELLQVVRDMLVVLAQLHLVVVAVVLAQLVELQLPALAAQVVLV